MQNPFSESTVIVLETEGITNLSFFEIHKMGIIV